VTPIRAIRQAWARASFATVIPVAAFLMGALLSILFTAYYFGSAYETFKVDTKAQKEQLARALAGDLADNDIVEIHAELAIFAPMRARVLDAEGNVIAGQVDPKFERLVREYPIQIGDQNLGTLVAAPSDGFKPPIAYGLAVFIILLISLLAAGCMRLFAARAASYVDRVTEIVTEFNLRESDDLRGQNLIFAEFRRLNVATVRTTRRVAGEIKRLRASAMIDDRTGLMNDKALDAKMNRVLQSATYINPAALITIDLRVQSGDHERVDSSLPNEAVVEIAGRLSRFSEEAIKARDLPIGSWPVAVLSGDQFCLVIDKGGAREDMSVIIRDLQTELRQPIKLNDQTFSLAANGSIVMVPEDADSVLQVKQRARATINDIKAQDKTGFAFYSPGLERQRDARIKLETELREAVNEDRFIPLYQPKVDLSTGRIIGAEALARWRLESGRLVSPSVFIDLAEQTGLINGIGEQIMRKACMEAAQWAHRGHRLNLAVNVSPRQFERDGLAQMILDALAKSGLSPRQLEIEITESLAIQQPHRVRSVLSPLRKLGIKLAVDDFGTGHSNLAVLTQFDFDVFKIDRQFVSGTPNDRQANAIVEMILGMATTLDMQIVGEGIETPQQAEFLKRKGCHIAQGYLYSPPITAAAFRKMLDEQPFMATRLSA
jgi:EAL domain-containing protein (putative c-di-GMP-specific phosphodiesterase class I)/GGDEF domain-containing protein